MPSTGLLLKSWPFSIPVGSNSVIQRALRDAPHPHNPHVIFVLFSLRLPGISSAPPLSFSSRMSQEAVTRTLAEDGDTHEWQTGPLHIADGNHSMNYLITEIEGPKGFLSWVKDIRKPSRNVLGNPFSSPLAEFISGGLRGGQRGHERKWKHAALSGRYLKIHTPVALQTGDLTATLEFRGSRVERRVWLTALIFHTLSWNLKQPLLMRVNNSFHNTE